MKPRRRPSGVAGIRDPTSSAGLVAAPVLDDETADPNETAAQAANALRLETPAGALQAGALIES
jgi:hypothetical protein